MSNTTQETTRPVMPAGFTEVKDPNDAPKTPIFAEGPKKHVGNIQVSSEWFEPSGLEFVVRNNNGSDPLMWTREELEELPDVISDVLEEIDLHAALAVLRTRPDLLEPDATVNKLCDFAMEQGLRASSMFSAYQELTKGQADD